MPMPTMIRIATSEITREALDTILKNSQEGRNGLSQLSQDESFYYMVIEDFDVMDSVLTALEKTDVAHTVIRQEDGGMMSASYLNLAASLQSERPAWLPAVQKLFIDFYAHGRPSAKHSI
jgi:hypothetical protein